MKRELNIEDHPHYVEDLRSIYEGRVPGGADLVCYWYRGPEKPGRAKNQKVGLLATNSIRQGANRFVLETIAPQQDFHGMER